MMKQTVEFGNDAAKIKQYRQFWSRQPADRPMVGFSFKTWFPLTEFKASREWMSSRYLLPDMITPEAFVDDQLRLLREGETIDDDIIRGASPSQAVDWIPALIGHDIRVLPESTLGEEKALTWDQIDAFSLDQDSGWFRKYREFFAVLDKAAQGRFPLSAPPMYGPCDIFAIWRGHGQSIYDLLEEPEKSQKALWKAAEVFVEIIKRSAEAIPDYMDGRFDAQYQLWSPGSIVRLQEDATSLYSPEIYRKFLQPIDRYVASQFASCFIHLHSSSMFLLDDFLAIDEIKCFQVNIDVSGPPVQQMLPYFTKIQQAAKPLLIRGSFTPAEMSLLMDHLEPRGLYLYIMVASMAEIETLMPLLGL